MTASVAPITCRWKHLRGEGRRAIYRATCGRAACPGHLGELSYTGSFTDEAAKAEELAWRERRQLERAVARGQTSANIAELLMRESEETLEEGSCATLRG